MDIPRFIIKEWVIELLEEEAEYITSEPALIDKSLRTSLTRKKILMVDIDNLRKNVLSVEQGIYLLNGEQKQELKKKINEYINGRKR